MLEFKRQRNRAFTCLLL